MIEVTETEMKICHMLDNLPPEQRTKAYLASKLNIHPRNMIDHFSVLKAKGLIVIGKSATGQNHYFLKEELRKKLSDVLVMSPSPPPRQECSV